MSRAKVGAFDFGDSEANSDSEALEDKLHAHGLTVEDVDSVLDRRYLLKRNRMQRRASHLLIGRDHHARCLAVPIVHLYDDVWRPVTAWVCKLSEEVDLRKVE
jgi:hypothetical protein